MEETRLQATMPDGRASKSNDDIHHLKAVGAFVGHRKLSLKFNGQRLLRPRPACIAIQRILANQT